MLRWALIFFCRGARCSRVWLLRSRFGSGGNCEDPVLHLPGSLPRFVGQPSVSSDVTVSFGGSSAGNKKAKHILA